MAIGNLNTAAYKNLTATGNLASGPGALLGFYVCSTTSGTITLYDNSASDTSNPITGTITPAVGFHPLPLNFANGLRAVLANTINVTFVYTG